MKFTNNQLLDMYQKEKGLKELAQERALSLQLELDKLQSDYKSLDENYDILADKYAELKELQDF